VCVRERERERERKRERRVYEYVCVYVGVRWPYQRPAHWQQREYMSMYVYVGLPCI
jgi:hypothetical protein